MIQTIDIGEITVEVVLKNIKNIHLSVYPPSGEVKIAAPSRMDLETIRMYAISKLSWIKQQQKKLRQQQRESARDYVSMESHYFLGKRYLLKVEASGRKAGIEIKHDKMILSVKPDTSTSQKQLIVQEWYREQLKKIVPPLIQKWEALLGVKVHSYGIKKMKTKWGTCNIEAGRIWLNLELAKKPVELLEYIIVHEMVHLLERNHNERFVAYMNRYLPQWEHLRAELNRLPLGHVEW